jgi:hypothetical protein
MLPERLNAQAYSLTEAFRDLRDIQSDEVETELPRDIVGGCRTVRNFHERIRDLRSASMASVRLFTDSQNSSSKTSPESNPSRRSASNSLSVPSNPGFVRCSTANSAASTTSSMDPYAPRLMTACIRCSCSGVRRIVIVVARAARSLRQVQNLFRGPARFLDLFLQHHDRVDQLLGPRRASGNIYVDRDHLVHRHQRVIIEYAG